MRIDPIVAVEIGTSTIRVFSGEAREDGGLTITAFGECPSAGVRKGEVTALDALSPCIDSAIRKVESALDASIDRVIIALSGSRISSLRHTGECPIQGEVTESDIARALDAARSLPLSSGFQIMHSIPCGFRVDGIPTRTPLGLSGSRLEADMLLVQAMTNRMHTLTSALRDQKLEIQDVIFSGLCAATSALDPEQKQAGVALLDLGGGTTDYVVYAACSIADAGALAVGGDHLTNDIAKAFRLPTPAAETLKREYGQAMIQATGRTRRIPLPVPQGATPRMAVLSDLETVIHVRMEETFQIIRDAFRSHGLLPHLNAGIVLTGGGACLPGVAELAGRVFELPCRIGAPNNVRGLTTNLARPDYATIIGALLCGYHDALREASRSGSLWRSIKRWFGAR